MADPKSPLASRRHSASSEEAVSQFRSIVAKSAGDHQPHDSLSKRLHWQIPDTEILYRRAIPVLRLRDPPTLLFGPL